MTENGQGNAPQAVPQPGAPWGPDPAYAQAPQAPGQVPPPPGPGEPGHVLGPGWEGPGQPHGYGYPPLPEAATQYIPPVPAGPTPGAPGTPYAPPVPGAPGPQAAPAYHEAATQYVPPVPAGPAAPGYDEAATQYIPPVPAGPAVPGHDEAATQYIPPVPAGPVAPPHDEAATQYIPPVTDGMDGLFRDGDGLAGSDGHTQQLPPIQEPVLRQPRPYPPRGQHPQQQFHPGAHPQQQFAAPPPPEPARRVPPAVIAAVVVGLGVVGLGVGALLSDDKAQNNDPAAAAAAPTPTAGSSAAAAVEAPVDPARSQAVQLDKLLADSNDSRSTVIKAVDDIKACRNLGTAAGDLRDAARQREELVTRLQDVKMDQLPNNERLSAALTKAWKASADADNSYAAWADDIAGDKKGCKDGRARSTDDANDGNKSSAEATRAKESAATMWNTIAAKYGLTKRDKSQL
ncbi:hypothetical protein ACFV7Q_06465 [Streptomyces sp. NPDC059851]|uniref:hypothetical protein n=1 Tax=Streptomyces sp. NPDC059851 TaxID=3346971 RepID=UPI00365C300C